MTGPTHTRPTRTRRRRPRALLAVGALALAALASACTPAEFQRWWTDGGRAPLSEPELSTLAAAATRYWDEVYREDRFSYQVRPIDSALAARMTPTSWRPGCPVALADLRHVRVAYMRLDGTEQIGELVVRADVARYLEGVFQALWEEDFRFGSMQLVDDFGGDDAASMAANNTSAFNCRAVAGTSTWSQHSYGTAIDINPVQNPYVGGTTVEPPSGAAYLDRQDVRPGMLVTGGAGVNVFRFVGWGWGGDWRSAKDYQHVSRSGT